MLNNHTNGRMNEGLIVLAWRSYPLLFIFAICLFIEIMLVILDLYVNWYGWSESVSIRRLFDIAREDSLPTLFAVVQTLMVAFVVWAIYIFTARNSGRKAQVRGWLVLALFFSYMVIDDGAKVHERIGTAVGQSDTGIDFPSYTWQFVIAPLYSMMGVFMVWFLWRQGKQSIQRVWLLAALGCLGAAILLDYVEGVNGGHMMLVDSIPWSVQTSTDLQILIHVRTITHYSIALEEFLEMLGMSFLLILFLKHLGFIAMNTEVRILGRNIQFIDHTDTSA